jgi:hypothetical protein
MASGDTLLVFTPWCNEPPDAGYAVADARNGRPILVFDDAVARTARFSGVLPRHYRGGGVTVAVGWMSTTTRHWIDVGDTPNHLADWSLVGETPDNIDDYAWYWDAEVSGAETVVSVYRDRERTQRLARGSVVNATGGTISLVPVGDSGVSGSVYATPNLAPNTDPDNRVLLARVAWEAAWERHQPGVDDMRVDGFAPAHASLDIPAAAPCRLCVAAVPFDEGAAMAGVAVGEHFRLRITRNTAAGPGNMPGDAELVFVELRET